MDFLYTACTLSGAGTNLKVGGTGPAQSAGKIFGGAPPLFWL